MSIILYGAGKFILILHHLTDYNRGYQIMLILQISTLEIVYKHTKIGLLNGFPGIEF